MHSEKPQSSITVTKRLRPRPGRRKEGRNQHMPRWWPLKGSSCPQEYPEFTAQKRQISHLLPDGPLGMWSAPVGINLRLLVINANSWETDSLPLDPKRPRTRGPAQVTAQDWGGPLQLALYNRFTSLEWSQEHKWMWQVSQSFSYSVGGQILFVLTSFSGPFFIDLHHHGSHRQAIQQAFYYTPLLCLGGIWIFPQFFTNAWLS